MLGSAPKRRFHRPFESTTTLPPRGRSSATVNVRPRVSWAPNNRKNSLETWIPFSCSGRSPPDILIPGPPASYAATSSKTCFCARQMLYLGTDAPAKLPSGVAFMSCTMRSGWGYGSGFNSTVLTTEKMAVLAPMPRASAEIAVMVKPGLCRSMRSACFRSLSIVSIFVRPPLPDRRSNLPDVPQTQELSYHSHSRGGQMNHTRCRNLMVSLFPLLGPILAGAQTHPLDALKTQEYWTVYEVLQGSGRIDKDTYYASVLLHEPAKDKVLAWKSGDPVPREADVILLRKGQVIEARVDVAGRKVESWKEPKGVQAPIIESEFHELSEAAKNDPRVREALAKRGITDLTTVECDLVPFGYFALPELEGHRIMYGECADHHGAYLSWGRSIEGLVVEVDAVEKKVLKVVDEGPVPVPSSPINFQEEPAIARPGTTPLAVTQPLGPSFQMAGGEVSWQNWHFRFRLDPRLGPIVNLVRFDDGTKLRSVLYEGSLSELFVPYMDPALGWATRIFIDAGEFFHGGVLRPLREGADCPANAAYFDALVPNEHGMPVLKRS